VARKTDTNISEELDVPVFSLSSFTLMREAVHFLFGLFYDAV
jgi:hypothetical protein